MHPNILELWLNALESNLYKQGQHYLHRKDLFCCLGVLCDIYIKKHGLEWRHQTEQIGTRDGLYEFESSTGVLPAKVVKWAGLSNNDPVVMVNGNRYTLSQLNDTHLYSFGSIANILRDNFLQGHESSNQTEVGQCS